MKAKTGIAMVKVTCANPPCGKVKDVRQADVKRGWGKFCSKSCKGQAQRPRTPAPRPETDEDRDDSWDGHKDSRMVEG